MVIEPAKEDDRDTVLALLERSELPAAGVDSHFDAFLVARHEDGSLAGCIGLEVYDDVGLLRSLAVRPETRGGGVGRCLVDGLLEAARARGLRSIYLLTTTAEAYFPRFGFQVMARERADDRLAASEEFRGACPDSAVLMHLTL